MAQIPLTQSRVDDQFLEVENGWSIAYRDSAPLRSSGETPIVFLNGLGDDYHAWTPTLASFPNRRRLQVDLRGQGLSLQRRLACSSESDFRIKVHGQSDDLIKLLDHLKIDRISLAAFSYGGGVAFDFASRYPERTETLALIVPFVMRLDRSFALQRLWSWQWQTARALHLVPASVATALERAYEKFLSAYMNQRFDDRMQNSEHRRVAIELTHGMMAFDAFNVLDKLPDHGVNLLTGDCDTLIPPSLFREFWRRLPQAKRGLWTRVHDGEHLLLEQKPELVSQWLKQVLNPA